MASPRSERLIEPRSRRVYAVHRNRLVSRRNAHARPLSATAAEAYPPVYDYVEMQIGNETRPVAVVGHREAFRFVHKATEASALLVGVAPILDEVDSPRLREWQCGVDLESAGRRKRFDIVMPYGDEGEEFSYFPGDGWVDLKCKLDDFAPGTCTITITCEAKNAQNSPVLPAFSIASPQVRTLRKTARNVVLISVESLTDLSYLSRAYGFGALPNFGEFVPRRRVLSSRIHAGTDDAVVRSVAPDGSSAQSGTRSVTTAMGLMVLNATCSVGNLTALSEGFKREGGSPRSAEPRRGLARRTGGHVASTCTTMLWKKGRRTFRRSTGSFAPSARCAAWTNSFISTSIFCTTRSSRFTSRPRHNSTISVSLRATSGATNACMSLNCGSSTSSWGF